MLVVAFFVDTEQILANIGKQTPLPADITTIRLLSLVFNLLFEVHKVALFKRSVASSMSNNNEVVSYTVTDALRSTSSAFVNQFFTKQAEFRKIFNIIVDDN